MITHFSLSLMSPPTADLDHAIVWAATLIEFVGAFFILAAAVKAVAGLVCTRGDALGVIAARLTLAEGAVATLGFKTAATLLKTLELRSWRAIAFFAAVLALRTFIKQGLAWETARLRTNAIGLVGRASAVTP